MGLGLITLKPKPLDPKPSTLKLSAAWLLQKPQTPLGSWRQDGAADETKFRICLGLIWAFTILGVPFWGPYSKGVLLFGGLYWGFRKPPYET